MRSRKQSTRLGLGLMTGNQDEEIIGKVDYILGSGGRRNERPENKATMK